MEVRVRLHGVLRDKLPGELKGRTAVTLPDTAVLQDLLDVLAMKGYLQTAVNEQLIDDWQIPLKEGDQIDIFRPAAGG